MTPPTVRPTRIASVVGQHLGGMGTTRVRDAHPPQTSMEFHPCPVGEGDNLGTNLARYSGHGARFSTIHRPYYFVFLW